MVYVTNACLSSCTACGAATNASLLQVVTYCSIKL